MGLIRKDVLGQQLTTQAFSDVALMHVAEHEAVAAAAHGVVFTALNILPDDEIPNELQTMLSNAMEAAGIATDKAVEGAQGFIRSVQRNYMEVCQQLG